jgi:Flp pilus assembly pilin Flp
MFAYCFALLERVRAEKKGVTALEYGVIASVAVVTLLLAFQTFYGGLSDVFTKITGKL